MSQEKHYCDNCGAASENPFQEGWNCYAELPFDVASANEGESATLCQACDKSLCQQHEPIQIYTNPFHAYQLFPMNKNAETLLKNGRKTIEFKDVIQAIKDGKKVHHRFYDNGILKWINWTIA